MEWSSRSNYSLHRQVSAKLPEQFVDIGEC